MIEPGFSVSSAIGTNLAAAAGAASRARLEATAALALHYLASRPRAARNDTSTHSKLPTLNAVSTVPRSPVQPHPAARRSACTSLPKPTLDQLGPKMADSTWKESISLEETK